VLGIGLKKSNPVSASVSAYDAVAKQNTDRATSVGNLIRWLVNEILRRRPRVIIVVIRVLTMFPKPLIFTLIE
jgi:hypothetical protein